MPSKEEMEQAVKNLREHDFKVDYVITHCAPSSVQREIEENLLLHYADNYFTDWLDELIARYGLQFRKWYCGHYHTEKIIDRIIFIFESIKLLDSNYNNPD